MQCKSYFPGLHTSRDLNVDTNDSNWPMYNADKALDNVYCYNGFMRPPVQDQELLYGKEVIKQTILKHENIFRDQVLELHRLYKRQTDLMDEIRRKKLHEYHIQIKTSQPNPIHSEISFECPQKMLNFPNLPWVNPNCSRSSVSGVDIIQPLFSYVERKSAQIGHEFSQTEGSLEESKPLESKGKKFQKKMLDLQLPASEYMDSDEGELFEDEKACDVPEGLKCSMKKISEVFPDRDTKLPDHGGGVKHVSLSNAPSPKSSLSKITGLFDLNEPFQLEEVASPNSVDFLGPISKHSEIPCQDMSRNTSTSFQVCSQNTQSRSDLEACSNNLDKDKKENQLESQTCNDEAGEKMNDLNSFAHGFGLEQLPTSSNSSQVESTEARELPMSLVLDQSNIKSWEETTTLGSEVSDRKHDVLKDNYAKCVGASNTPESYQLAPYIANSESSSISSWRKSIRDVKRNPIAIQALPCFHSLAPSKSSKSSVGSSGLIGDKIKLSKRMRYNPCSTGVRSDSLHAFSSCIRGIRQNRDELGNCPSDQHTHSRRFSSCTSPSGSNKSQPAVEDLENSEKIQVVDINLVCDPTLTSGTHFMADNVVVKTGCHKELSGIGDQMNLASCTMKFKLSSKSFIPREMKIAKKIDLEAPLSPENEDWFPPRGEYNENEFDRPFQVLGLADGDPAKELVRLAAEAIVSISSIGVQICLESATCESSESADSLHWFAGVVSSMAGGSETEVGGKNGGEELSYDAFDYFEVMTLKLTETKIEEYWCNSNGQKEEKIDANLVPIQQRKGRTRRGRQWKDFQREVLPCLASLSRYEVTEDLQTIEGLMEAAGNSKKTGLARRHAGRNGWSRGRKRSCVSASYMEESALCYALKQQTKNDEVGLVERSITGWGKITRRRRGQRSPATNLPPLILSQV